MTPGSHEITARLTDGLRLALTAAGLPPLDDVTWEVPRDASHGLVGSTPLVAGLAIGLILLGAIVVIAVTMMPDKPRPQDSNLASADPLKSTSPVTPESPDMTPAISAASPASSVSPTRGNTLEAPANDSDQEIGRAARTDFAISCRT